MNLRSIRSLRIAGALAVAAVCSGAHAQKDPLGKKGGHPLARRPASLEDLLNQPDWSQPPPLPPPAAAGFGQPAEPTDSQATSQPGPEGPLRESTRPKFVQLPAAFVASPNSTRDLQAAIDDRNKIVDRADLFDTIDTIVKGEIELRRRATVLNAALVLQKRAADNADMLNHPGANQVAPAAKAAARRAWEAARDATRLAQGDWQRQVDQLQPLYNKVRPEIGPWLACYGRMRRMIRPDRRDPDRPTTLGVFEGAVRSRNDFVEGRVLASLLRAYEGDAGAAEVHLGEACEAMARHNLFGTPFACDGCYAYLLLDRPDMVTDFIAALRKIEPSRQTAFQCWLVGLAGMMTCRDNEASTYLQKALAKIDFYKKENVVSFEETPLLGDAALFRLTAANETVRDVNKARQILETTKPEWDVWQLRRARAALAAEDGNWAEALAELDRCAAACPPALSREVQDQREAYAAGARWVRPRPGADKAARP